MVKITGKMKHVCILFVPRVGKRLCSKCHYGNRVVDLVARARVCVCAHGTFIACVLVVYTLTHSPIAHFEHTHFRILSQI